MKLTRQAGICAMLITLGWQGPALAGDTLLVHGHIYTGNPRAPWASALSVSGTRIEAVGTDAAILKRRGSRAQVIDLHGQTVIPGIVDSHTHVLYGAYELHGLNLSTPESSVTPEQPDLLVERLKAYAAAHPHDAVLFGRADFSTVPPSTPRSALLDSAVPDRPFVIHNTAGHALWLNSAALRMAGIGDQPVADGDEERGVIRDASGHRREFPDRRLGRDLATHRVEVLEFLAIPRRNRDGREAGIVPAQMLLMPVDRMRSILIMSRMVHGECPGRVEVSLTQRTLERPQPNVPA